MNRLSLALLISCSLSSLSYSQSGDDVLQFGQNVDLDIRSDKLELPSIEPALGERVLYGFSIAATDEILAVGAPHCDERGGDRGGDFAGAVYIYQRVDDQWEPFPDINGLPLEGERDFKLYPSGLQAGDFFGWSVDLSLNADGSHTLVVGAPGTRHADTNRADTGSVYVFDLPANSYCWQEVPESPLRLPSGFRFALATPEDWEDDNPDTTEWSYPSGIRPMPGIFSIPEERYGESVSIFSGELPRISGETVDGLIAVGAPKRDIYGDVFVDDPDDDDDEGPEWDVVSREVGGAFLWYRVNGRWILPNAECVDGQPLASDPPELDKDEDFFCDSRWGRFMSTDLVDFGGNFSRFAEFGTKVQIVVDTEESNNRRRPLLVVSALKDRGGSGSVKWFDIDFPDNYDEDDYPFPHDPFATTVYPGSFNGAPLWAGRIGADFDALPLDVGPQPSAQGDFQLTVIGMPGNGGQGEAVVVTRAEDGQIFSVDRLDRLWTDNGYFPSVYPQLGNEEQDEGFTAWSEWFGNPQYSSFPPMQFGSTVQFAGTSDDRSEFILIGAPGLTGIQPDVDPDDFDFDILPDPDREQLAMGGVFVFEYSNIPGGPFGSQFQRTGLVLTPERENASNAYRRLGESMSRIKLTPDEEDALGDDLELFMVELSADKVDLDSSFVRPRKSVVQNLIIDIDDLEDSGDVEDAFGEGGSTSLESSALDLADRREFGFVTAVSEDGNWLAVGSPYSTVPVNRPSAYVTTENGTSFLADGAIYESGEVYIFQRTIVEDKDPSGGTPVGERIETWDLYQIIRSPSVSPLLSAPGSALIARDVFKEKFGYSLDISPDGKTLLVGAWGGGGRLSFEDANPFSARGISYLFYRSDTKDRFLFKRPFSGRARAESQQGFSVSVSDDSEGSLLVSGSPRWSNPEAAEVRTGRAFIATHNSGNFSTPFPIQPLQLVNERRFGAAVAATSRNGQNIYAVGATGPSTEVFTPTTYRSGLVEIRGGGTDVILDPVNTASDFGRSLSFSNDYLAAGSVATPHFYDFGTSVVTPDVGYVFTPLNVAIRDEFGYLFPEQEGITVDGSEVGLGLSNQDFSRNIQIIDSDGGVSIVGDTSAFGANLNSVTTGGVLMLDFNDSMDDPAEWNLLNSILIAGDRRLSSFGMGLSLGVEDRKIPGTPKSQQSIRAYVAGTTANPGSVGNQEPDCSDLLINSPRLFESRNQIFLFETAFFDCNNNDVPDSSEIAENPSFDCNNDGILDQCQADIFTDCNDNLIPDECELAGQDCNGNGILDFCDIEDRNVDDVNADGIPDVCQCLGDVNLDGTVNAEDFNQVFDFIQASGQSDPPCLGCPEDVNNDGLVNILDLNYITTFSGSCP